MITPDLLDALLSPDTNHRSQAEAVYHSMTNVDRVQGLMSQMVQTNQPNQQQFIAVLLRRDILKLTDSTMLKELALPLLQTFMASRVVAVGHCLSEVCATLALISPVDVPITMILNAIQPKLLEHNVPSLKLLASLAERAPVAFTAVALPSLPSLVHNIENLPPVVLEALMHVFCQGAIATTLDTATNIPTAPLLDSILVDANSPAATLCAPLCNVLLKLAQVADMSVVQSSLQHLVQLSVTCPTPLACNRSSLETTVQTCVTIVQTAPEVSVKLMAIQLLASLVSVGDVKRRILPSNADIVPVLLQVMPVAMQLAAEGTDDDYERWAAEPASLVGDNSMVVDDDDAVYAESLVELLLQHLGVAALTVILPMVQQLVATTDNWKHPRAGLALLQCAWSATPVSLTPHLEQIVDGTLSLTASSNPRVQFQAIQLLGALCESQFVDIRETFGRQILEKLVLNVKSPCSKVAAISCLALVSYCRGKDDLDVEQTLLPYAADIIHSLVDGPLSSPSVELTVQVRAMGAIACVAEGLGEQFATHYSIVMPGLLACGQMNQPELAGAAVEAATIVAVAVGYEISNADARHLLSWVIPAFQQYEQSAISWDQLSAACARLASVLSDEFVPCLEVVLPHLLKRAAQEPDISLVEGTEADLEATKRLEFNRDDDDDDGHEESMTVALPGRGLTKVTVNTTKIQEKSQATRAIYEYAKALGSSFGPHCQATFDALIPLVQFPYSSDVRGACAQTLAAVMEAACAYGEEIGMDVPTHYLPLLANAIAQQIAVEDTTDMETLYALADSLSEIYYIAYGIVNEKDGIGSTFILSNFTMDLAKHSVQSCIKAMVACLERRSETSRILNGILTGDDEREEYQAIMLLEESLLTPLVDSVGYVLKFMKDQFVLLFEQYIAPTLGPHLLSSNDVRASFAAVCLFDDCVEHCGPDAAAKYAPQLLAGVAHALQDPSQTDKDLLQASLYGIAQMARYAPSHVIAPHIQIIIQRLLAITSTSKTDDDDNVALIENAASALASLTLIGPNPPFPQLKFVAHETLVTSFLSQLPIREDEDEAKICHAGLCDLIEAGAIDLNQHGGELVNIIGQILTEVSEGEEMATSETCSRLTVIMSRLQQSGVSNAQQAFAALSPQAHLAFHAAMNDYTRTHVVTP